MRLHIIGIPSSGKTMLGMGMSTLLGVPHHDLDSIAFIDERWTLRPEQDRNAMIAGILEEPGFVTGGASLDGRSLYSRQPITSFGSIHPSGCSSGGTSSDTHATLAGFPRCSGSRS